MGLISQVLALPFKAIASALVALLAALIVALKLIPGNQGEDFLQKVQDFLSKLAPPAPPAV